MATYWQRFVRTPLHNFFFREEKGFVRKDVALLDELKSVDFQPVFILGEARSGTTILYEILYETGCFNIVTLYHIMHEHELISNHINGETAKGHEQLNALIEQRGIKNRGLDKISARSDSPYEFAYLLSKQTGCSYVTDENFGFFERFCKKVQLTGEAGRPLLLKNITDGRNFRVLKQLMPNAKFVFINRDPIDILISQFRTLNNRNTLLEIISKEYRSLLESRTYKFLVWLVNTRFGESLAVKILTKRMQHFEKVYLRDLPKLDPSDWISLRYEDLCSSPNQEITRILEFCGCTVPPALDMASRISPRQMKPLPAVEKRRAKLEKLFEARRRHHGYIKE